MLKVAPKCKCWQVLGPWRGSWVVFFPLFAHLGLDQLLWELVTIIQATSCHTSYTFLAALPHLWLVTVQAKALTWNPAYEGGPVTRTLSQNKLLPFLNYPMSGILLEQVQTDWVFLKVCPAMEARHCLSLPNTWLCCSPQFSIGVILANSPGVWPMATQSPNYCQLSLLWPGMNRSSCLALSGVLHILGSPAFFPFSSYLMSYALEVMLIGSLSNLPGRCVPR